MRPRIKNPLFQTISLESVRRVIYVIIGLIIALTVLEPYIESYILTVTTPYEKNQFIDAILEERTRVYSLPIILVVNSSSLSGVTLPKDIGGTPVKLVNETEFDGMPTLPYTTQAVHFTYVNVTSPWSGEVKFSSDYGLINPRRFNSFWDVEVYYGFYGWTVVNNKNSPMYVVLT